MSKPGQSVHIEPERLLVVQPSWVGDAVMATPTLRALRTRFPDAEISYLMKRHLKPLYRGLPYADRLLTHRKTRVPKLAARLKKGDFDAAVLLPGSFRTALLAKTAGIRRIVGYNRDGRGFLLTDKLLPQKQDGRFLPVPMVKTYLGIAHYLGAGRTTTDMDLVVTADDRAEGSRVLAAARLEPGRFVVLNPGANFGSSKCWAPANFAAVADALADRGYGVAVSGSPKERPIADAIFANAKSRPADLIAAGVDLGSLKHVLAEAALLVTGDTGPRHMAAALDTPVVTRFGPTDPRWTTIDFPKERQVSVPVFCGPCQKKTCPLDHRCMTRITPDMVLSEADALLDPK